MHCCTCWNRRDFRLHTRTLRAPVLGKLPRENLFAIYRRKVILIIEFPVVRIIVCRLVCVCMHVVSTTRAELLKGLFKSPADFNYRYIKYTRIQPTSREKTRPRSRKMSFACNHAVYKNPGNKLYRPQDQRNG